MHTWILWVKGKPKNRKLESIDFSYSRNGAFNRFQFSHQSMEHQMPMLKQAWGIRRSWNLKPRIRHKICRDWATRYFRARMEMLVEPQNQGIQRTELEIDRRPPFGCPRKWGVPLSPSSIGNYHPVAEWELKTCEMSIHYSWPKKAMCLMVQYPFL